MSSIVHICDENENTLSTGCLHGDVGRYLVALTQQTDALEMKQRVYAYVLDESFGVSKFSGVVKMVTSTQVIVGKIKYLGTIDRRNTFKVKTNISTRVTKYFVRGDTEPTNLDEPFVATLRDISVGGIFMVTDKAIQVGETYLIPLKATDLDVLVKTLVLRNQPTNGEPNGYGCRFVDLPESVEDKICNYVFNVQLKDRKRKLGL